MSLYSGQKYQPDYVKESSYEFLIQNRYKDLIYCYIETRLREKEFSNFGIMEQCKIIFVCVFLFCLNDQLSSQSLVLVLRNEKNNTEYIIENSDKILLDIKNKKGKLKEKEEVVVVSVDKEKLYVLPEKERLGEQAIKINEIKNIWITTAGTKVTGGLIGVANLASKTSNVPTVYIKINLDKSKWVIQVGDTKR